MSLSWLLPTALFALFALAVPLLIHLARREQQSPTVFAALRWLRERPKSRRRIRFDEWPLLLLRLLLLALLALWLARPVLHGAPDRTPWTVVAPGVATEDVQRLAVANAGELRWLAAGFPPLSEPMPASPQPIASLLRELDASLPRQASLTVLVPAQLAGMDGAPLELSREVDWRVVSGASPSTGALQDEPSALVIRHAEGQGDAVRILHAATLARHGKDAAGDGREPAIDIAPVDMPLPAGTRRLAWLATGPLSGGIRRWIEQGGDALLASEVEVDLPSTSTWAGWRDADGAPLVEIAAMGRGRVLKFTRPLRPADLPQVLDSTFPETLQALFDAAPMPTRMQADLAMPRSTDVAWPLAPRDLQPWLALLIALLALLERWWATSPRREARA